MALSRRPTAAPFRLPLAVVAWLLCCTSTARGQDTASVRDVNDQVSLRFVDTDLRSVVAALGRYLSKPVVASDLPAVKVSLQTPEPVSRAVVADLLRGVVEAHGLVFEEDSTFFRVGPRPPAPAAATASPSQTGAAGPVQLYVIRLKHARAPDVAATVNLLFGNGGEFSGSPGLSTGTLSDELRRNVVPPDTQPGVTTPTGAARNASFAGQVTIVPDQLTNALLIRATPADYALLKDAVDQLDIRPLEVLIEVLIVEARHDRTFSLGTSVFLPKQTLDGGTAEGQITGGGIGDMVIKLMGLGKAQIDATLNAAQEKGDVQIMSRPVLLASNNTEASFLVGSQRPFVQVSRSLPTDTPTRDQVVQYKDVGTKLSVRPTINEDGYVSLFLQQEVNAATAETQFDAPVISTREATTQVLVRDGQTIVIGGLTDHQVDKTSSGVPILSGIPIIGGLFGGTRRQSSSTELFLFLTPRIIRTDADADSLTQPRLPVGERSLPADTSAGGVR